MLDLPSELWLSVVSQLDADELPKAMGINRFLYEYCLDHLCRHIDLLSQHPNREPDGRTFHRLCSLMSPSFGVRVRQLSVKLSDLDAVEFVLQQSLDAPPPVPVETPLPRWRKGRFFKRKHNTASHNTASSSDNYPMLRNIIQGLVNVDDLTMYCDYTQVGDLTRIPPLLDFLWSTMSPRKVSLDLPPTAVGVALHGLRAVDHLAITQIRIGLTSRDRLLPDLHCPDPPFSSDAECIHSLARLVNASRDSLVSLKISDRCQFEGISSVLCQIGHIPHLETVNFTLMYAQQTLANARAITAFLRPHDATLRDLHLDLAHESPAYDADLTEDGLEGLELNHLRSLHLNPYVKTPRPLAIARLGRYFGQTQILNISIGCGSISEFELKTMLGAQGCPQLVSLTVCVERITRSLFGLFVETLPALRTLSVSGHAPDTHHLAKMLSTPLLPKWGLREILIQTPQSRSRSRESLLLMMAMAISVPTIRHFVGWESGFDNLVLDPTYARLRQEMAEICPGNGLYSAHS